MSPPPLVCSRAKKKEFKQTGKYCSRIFGGVFSVYPGKFVMHPECCAQVDGNRHTVTLHDCGPDDPLFVSLVPLNRHKPTGKKTKKASGTSGGVVVPQCPSCAPLASGILEVGFVFHCTLNLLTLPGSTNLPKADSFDGPGFVLTDKVVSPNIS
jgi:hypothetical protein